MHKKFFKVVVDENNDDDDFVINEATKDIVDHAKDVYGNLAYLLAQAMHFTLEEFRHDTGGERLPDGNWTGVIGMLNRSEVDIAVVPLFITEERSQAIDYSYPFIVSEITFATKKPEFIPNKYGIFHVFGKPVWIALCISIIITTFMNYALRGKKDSFANILFHVVGTILKQSSSIKPQAAAEKLLSISWLFCGTFLSLFYGSVLLSFLSFPVLDGISTVPQLAKAVEAGSYQCVTLAGSSAARLLATSSNNISKLIGKNIQQNPDGYSNIKSFIKQSSQRNIAYIDTRHVLNVLKYNHLVSEDGLSLTFGAIAARKNFCCKLELDKAIRAIVEAGLYGKLMNDNNFVTSTSFLRLENSEIKIPRKISVSDISGAIITLVVGYVVSLFVFLVELFLPNRYEKHLY